MDRRPRIEDAVLRALERSRAMALEDARTVTAAKAAELTEKEATRDDLARAREASYVARRQRMSAGGTFSVQHLHWNHQYTASQVAQEKAAAALCELARAALQQAQDDTLRRLEELRVVEKLRARRRAEALRVDARRSQERLDELGLIKSRLATVAQTPS